MLGVFIAQCMRLTRSTNPDPVLGFYVASIPLSAICHVMALVTTILGCVRFLHWQSAMTHGQAISSGLELLIVFVLSLVVSDVVLNNG